MPTGRTVELTVLCEGSTESDFVTQVLHPHLVHHHVFAKPVGLDGKLTKSGGIVAHGTLCREQNRPIQPTLTLPRGWIEAFVTFRRSLGRPGHQTS